MSVRKLSYFGAGALLFLASMAAHATSHVRIVRLSYVDGKVQMERASGQGMERAILNAPIVEGARIFTGSNGLAEVEFEDNSTVRLGEATEVRFSQLLINDAGDKVNEVELIRGTIYFHTNGSKHDIDRVKAAERTFVVRHDSQLRFMMIGDQVQVAVFGGEAEFENNGQIARIKKRDTVTVDSTNPAGMVLAKGVESLPLDRWNSERAAYQNAYSYDNSGYGSKSMSGSGYSDLAYYGGFQFLPGYGMVWQPYGASSWLGWDPYSSGAWMLASGGQYAWASAYPWGWMPYHYGSWIYVPAGGWFWSPGNSFRNGGTVTNWQPTAPVVKAPPGYAAPTPPPQPTNGARPSVLVGRIGNGPAYIPGGPVPPNFRSVINDRSGLTGMRSPGAAGYGAGGSAATAAQASRATAASRAGAVQNGHVFVPPPAASPMSVGSVAPGFGGGQGSIAPVHNAGAPVHTAGGGGHSAATAGARGGSAANPK